MTEITEQTPFENDELLNICIHQCLICNYNNLPYIYRTKFDISKPPPSFLPKSFPKPYIYYHHTEDTDYISKIKDLPETLHNPDHHEVFDHYTDDSAETQYLNSAPVSYLIVGKPEIGQTELAQLLSDHWKCVYISPESVLREEVENDTRAGKCIKYNLEAGRSIGPEVILRLVEKRIKSQSVQHRGFVLSGFPMLKNELFKEDPISSESAVFNVQEIFDELLPGEPVPDKPGSVSLVLQSEVTVSTNKDKEEEKEEEKGDDDKSEGGDSNDTNKKPKSVKFPPKKSEIHLSKDIDLGPSQTTIVTHNEPFHSLKDPQEQLVFLQNLLETPLVLIYVMCGTLDVQNKRSNYRYNIYLQREVFSPEKFDESPPQTKQTSNMSMFDDDNIRNFPSTDPKTYTIDGNTMKIQVQIPMHFKKSISTQLWQYKCHVHAALKQQIMEHNPQNFIKADGRLSSQKMFEAISDRLTMLAFQPVLLPERFIEEEDFGEFAADVQSPPAETQTPEEAFSTLRAKMIVGPMYKYELSNWAFKCPVALKEGRIVKGKTEYAVKFMSKLFFLSSEDALIKFYRNPRSYLLPIMPNPTCRIWIIGPRCSGRSVVAKCLSFLFSCKIIDPIILESIYMKRKEVDFLDKIRSAAIMEAQSELNAIREQERKEQIENWKEKSLKLLKKVVDFKLDESYLLNTKTVEEVASKEIQRTVCELELLEELQEMCLPSTSKVSLLQDILKEPNTVIDYLPEELRGPVEPATIFDSFVYERVDDVINSVSIPDMSLSIEEKVEMFKTEIDQAEEEYSLTFQKLGGWIIDGMILDMEVIEKLAPDYIADDIICLMDEENDHIFLLAKYGKKNFETFRDYKQVFEKLKLASTLDISYSVVSASSKMHFIDSVVSEVEDRVMSYVDSETTFEIINNERNRTYQEHLNEFKENWQILKTFLVNKNIIPVEINVEYKAIQDLLKETVIAMENRYRKIAAVMTEEDKAQEQIDYAEPLDGVGEGMFGEGEVEGNPDFFKDNRRLGYTNMYCPVTFDRYYVLWKGKEEFAVTFEQRVYLLSSEAVMNEFATNPRLFLKSGPPEDFPPARICVVGVPGGGKTTLAVGLANNYGLHYLNFDTLIAKFFNLPQNYDLEQIYRLDASLNSILNNHQEDLEKIKNYVENGTKIPNDLIKKILMPLWFGEPYKDVGFVLDNFPKRPSDLPVLISNYFIPDIVIELHATQEEAISRMLPIRFEQFRFEINEKRRIKELENEKIYNQWYEERLMRSKILAEEKREQRRIEAVELHIQNRKLLTTPVLSGVSLGKITEEISREKEGEGEEEQLEEEEVWFIYDEIMELEDLTDINKILDDEMPEPKFYDVWETEEETRQRVLTAFDGDFNRDIENIDNIRSGLQEENIDCTIVATDSASPEKVLYEIIRLADKFKFRNRSLFERVYEITIDASERLLYRGYYFVSKFGRTCPVQVYENINPIQMFFPGETKMKIFPLVYKRYIYFVYGEESRAKFKFDPLKYVLNSNYRFPLIPLRVAIIGPPKCGKSTLAKRFEKEFQLNLITRGSAIRYVQKKMKDCELTKNINFILDRGWSATYEMVAKAVETITMHSRSLSQGYVLDGFPNTQQEMNHFRNLGIVPHIIIDIQTSMEKIKEYSHTDFDKPPFPTFSFEYIKHLHDEWGRNAHIFRYYIHKEYQNVCSVENMDSKWHFWNQAKVKTFAIMKEFQDYIIKKERDNVIAVKLLCVTPSEFFIRQSVFLNYCPLCYYYDDYLLEGGSFPDRNCVFQYLREYYYICGKHQEQFITDPTKYIPPINEKLLPPDLPKILVGQMLAEVYEDGFCIVSFWDNQPKYVLLKGDINYAVIYKGIIYLFCSEYCMKKFLATPHNYFDKIIHFKNPNPVDLCELRKLPTLGYLEQLAARILIDAVIDVELRRPYFVGVNICKSAAIQIALYLKLNNPKTPKLIVPLYYEAKERCDARRERLTRCIAYFKGRLNPYVYYNEHYRPKIEPEDAQKSIEFDIQKWMHSRMPEPEYCEARRVPVPDSRFDYLCEYYKPASKVPAFLNVVDIAGLVKGASEGQGLGNAFLSHISACDAIFHLCRAFDDDDVTHVEGDVNPVRDLEIIFEELRLKDEETLMKNLEKVERVVARGTDKKMKPEYDCLAKVKTVLVDEKKHIRFADWSTNDIEILNKYLFLTSKPGIYLINLSDKDYIRKKNKWLAKIKEWVDKHDPGSILIPFSGAFEHKLVELEDPAERAKYLEEVGATSVLDKIIVQGYRALQLEYFFTSGADEVKAWTIQKGTKAPQAAGRIHTDFEKGFIMAEVMKYQDFKEEGSESAVKSAGKFRQQGRNYVVEDGDIILFKFNAGAGLKDGKKK